MGPSNRLSWETGSFSHCLNPYRFLQQGFEALFPHTDTLGCAVCLTPQLLLVVYLHVNVVPSSLPATTLPMWFSSCCLALSPLCPSCLSLPLLPVLMNVSSLTPCLSDFHTVRCSGSSGYFLFVNLLLSFFCLCEEAKLYLPMPPSWPEVSYSLFFKYIEIF